MNSRRRTRTTAVSGASALTSRQPPDSAKPELTDFLLKRDYTGAVAVLEFEKAIGEERCEVAVASVVESSCRPASSLWLAFCYFHIGQYTKAIEIYDNILNDGTLYSNTLSEGYDL